MLHNNEIPTYGEVLTATAGYNFYNPVYYIPVLKCDYGSQTTTKTDDFIDFVIRNNESGTTVPMILDISLTSPSDYEDNYNIGFVFRGYVFPQYWHPLVTWYDGVIIKLELYILASNTGCTIRIYNRHSSSVAFGPILCTAKGYDFTSEDV